MREEYGRKTITTNETCQVTASRSVFRSRFGGGIRGTAADQDRHRDATPRRDRQAAALAPSPTGASVP